jgi:hypothetical protein
MTPDVNVLLAVISQPCADRDFSRLLGRGEWTLLTPA